MAHKHEIVVISCIDKVCVLLADNLNGQKGRQPNAWVGWDAGACWAIKFLQKLERQPKVTVKGVDDAMA